MLRNYLTVAVRNLMRNKLYSTINIAGLAVGMACCFLILLLVQDELSYDQHHPYADRTYRVVWKGNSHTPAILAPTLKAYFPEIEEAVRFINGGERLIGYEEKHFYEKIYFTDANFFKVFSFSFLQGDPATALSDPNAVVITEEAARKYFGDANPLGKELMYENRTSYRVKGILKKTAHRSHLTFDFLASSSTLKDRSSMTEWTTHGTYTYAVLSRGYAPAELERRLPEFTRQHIPSKAGSPVLFLQSVLDIHLHPYLESALESKPVAQYLHIFTSIALLILFVACINFVNLSTARSAHRAREVGMRKVLGAHRLQLIRQFLGESILVSLISLALAVSLVEMILSGFNALFEKEIAAHYLSNWPVLVAYVLITLFVGVTSGAYSAFFLSSFEPVQVLKGALKSGTLNRSLRRGLVMFQFVISVVLIVSTVVISVQLRYLQNKRLGFDKEQVVVISKAGLVGGRYKKGTWNVRMLVETVLSMLTTVCHFKKVGHRVWAYLEARLAFTMALFNLLVQWNPPDIDQNGVLHLSIAQFSL